jgi:hypothetical protein
MNASPVGNSLNAAGLQIKDEAGSKPPTLSDSIFFATFPDLNFLESRPFGGQIRMQYD